MLSVAVTILVRETCKINPSVTFPQVTNMYYKEDAECLEFHWDCRVRLVLEQLVANQESEQQLKHNEDLEPKNTITPLKIPILKMVTFHCLNIMIKKGVH